MPKNTLSKKKDLDQIFKTGLSFYCPVLGLKCLVNTLGFNRLGIVIGLKVSKKAVVRNKIKRQIREIVRNDFPKTKNSYDIVVITMKGLETMDFLEIKEALLKLAKRLK